MSQLGYEAALVIPVGWWTRISGFDFRNWVIDLGKSVSACFYDQILDLVGVERLRKLTSLDQQRPVELLMMSAST
jgi:hypothetical protein